MFRWFDVSMVRCFDGSMFRWFDVSMVRWFDGSMFDGSMFIFPVDTGQKQLSAYGGQPRGSKGGRREAKLRGRTAPTPNGGTATEQPQAGILQGDTATNDTGIRFQFQLAAGSGQIHPYINIL
jgi:hypothetical protein